MTKSNPGDPADFHEVGHLCLIFAIQQSEEKLKLCTVLKDSFICYEGVRPLEQPWHETHEKENIKKDTGP